MGLKFSFFSGGVNVMKAALFAVLFAFQGSLSATPTQDWSALVKSAVKDQQGGRPKSAEQSLLKALLVADDFGPKDPRSAFTLDYLGTLYQQRGDSNDALAVFERARQGFIKALGEESPEAIESGQRLADAYAAAEKWKQAEPLYRASLERARAAKPVDAEAVASACTDLGLALDAQQQWDSALKLYKEAEALRRKALGDDDPQVAECLNNQGRVHLKQGDLKMAEKQIRAALAIDEKALSERDPAVVDDLRRLAAVLFKAGKVAESGQVGQRAEKLDAERLPTPTAKRLPAPED